MKVYKTGKDVFIISNGKPQKADCFAKLDSAGKKYAALFAAAPDLLEACKLCIKVIVDSVNYQENDPETVKAVELADQAINKAWSCSGE